ncbi:UNVERIFIED_CONTAM: hypothetical protein Scaly_1439200, partial [Sesamum calycinum]
DVDVDGGGEAWGSYVWMRVAIDITKPLTRALKIRTVLGDEQLVTFTYERLPNFCYLCGCLGHLSRQCELQFQANFCDPGANSPFGNWLRAVAPMPFRGRNGNVPSKEHLPSFKRPIFVSHSSLQSNVPNSPSTRGTAIFGQFSTPKPSIPSSNPPTPLVNSPAPSSEVFSSPVSSNHINDLNFPPTLTTAPPPPVSPISVTLSIPPDTTTMPPAKIQPSLSSRPPRLVPLVPSPLRHYPHSTDFKLVSPLPLALIHPISP